MNNDKYIDSEGNECVDPEDYASTIESALERDSSYGSKSVKAAIRDLLESSSPEPMIWKRAVAQALELGLVKTRIDRLNEQVESFIKVLEQSNESQNDTIDFLTETGVELTELSMAIEDYR